MRFIKNIFIGLTLLLGFGACQNEDLPTTSGEGKGRLVVGNVIVDVSTKDGVAITRAADGTFTAPDASELTYTLTNNTTGEVEYEQKEVPTDMLLAIGNYTLKAVYGENRMGTIPYLYKSVTFDIEKGKITNLTDFTVGLACAIIRPVISPELEAQYKNGLTLSLSDGTNVLSDIVNGTDYFVPSAQNYTLTCRGTNLIGKENSFSTSVNSAETKTRYNLNCNPDFPVFQLPEQAEGNAWAKRIYITPMTEKDITDAKGADKKTLLENMVYETSTNGTDWIPAIKQNDGVWLAINLTDETNYTIRARLNGTNIISSNTTSLMTETATQVPNGDFETLTQTISVSDMNQGGKYSVSPTNYQNTCSFTIQEPTGWSSVNAKTCNLSAANQMSWFVVPSTYNTTLYWNSKRGFGINNTDTPDIYKNLSAQNGNNAMVVRNVAWDANGSTPSKTGGAFNTTYYNTNVPSIANRSAGKLFLGSYTYSNGTESYNEGTEFKSRPLTLKGYYKYVNDSQDSNEKGIVIVTLLNREATIGQGKIELSAQSNYTEFSIPISYTSNIKATELKIMAASSNHASYTQSEENTNIKTTTYNGQREAISRGAILTIDNLTFDYQ